MVRGDALSIIASVVPCDWGDGRMAAITGGAYAPGYGTTCGYLCSYLLHELGCRDPRIVNRRDDEAALVYHQGENISRLVSGAKALGAWRDGPVGIRAGDMYLLSLGPAASEHVGVHLYSMGQAWRTADAGQTNAVGQQAARYCTRAFDGAALGGPDGGSMRPVVGYVDISAIPLPSRAPVVLAAAALLLTAAHLASG